MPTVKAYLYPACSTCRKAKGWLQHHGYEVEEVHIVDHPPSVEELRTLWEQSELPLKKLCNTSGQKYREMGLKDKLASYTEEEMLQLLASDGMLLKRPIVTNGEQVTIGFNEERFAEVWGK